VGKGARQNRPIAGRKSREELLALYESRMPAYEKYAVYTLVNDGSPDEVVSRFMSWLCDPGKNAG